MIKKGLFVLCLILFVHAAQAADVPVDLEHLAFNPDRLTIQTGDTVIFSNKDEVIHNVQVAQESGSVEDEGLQKPGEQVKVNFAEPGVYQVHCAAHPKMKMVITVN